ncbi:hypothetical protein AB0B50_40150 [Streptomyces sp. NPDC041068]|uniref:hypothetical protein n=1 Tax=Streptomyces sp. NPDC041068 TaxID=3155130 RepID=UPI0033DB849E
MAAPHPERGFIVSIPITNTVPAADFQEQDAFALPKAPDDHLIAQSSQAHPTVSTRLTIHALGRTAPLTVHPEELLLPLRMLRTFELTCQLCAARTHRVLDLVLHGTPQAWVCGSCA